MNVDLIKQKMDKKQFSLHKLSIESGVAYSTLHDLIVTQKDKNPKINTVAKIANCLDEEAKNLI